MIEVKPFDAAAWVGAFESLSNCTVGIHGPVHDDPDYDAPFTVTDPAVITAYRERHADDRVIREGEGPFIMGNRSMIAEVYAADPARVADLERRWDERRNERPTHVAMIEALAPWQRKAVRGFARQRAAVQAA